MKLKELPNSIITSFNLLRIPKDDLGLNAKDSNPKVVISFASIPYRLPRLHLVVRSLLNQNTNFHKIILWVHKDLKNKLPDRLTSLQSERFEIMFSDTTSSHRKLVETLKIYPKHYIVTCDDDLIYPEDWLERLLEGQRAHPKAIFAHMCRVVKYQEGKVLPYKSWEGEVSGGGSDMTIAIGAGGVLYPPESLHTDVTNSLLYNKLAPKADDLWFKVMSFMKGTPVFRTRQPYPEPVPIMFTQKHSLKKGNIKGDKNKEQWGRLVKHYKIAPPDIITMNKNQK